eukprot:SAG11_NODE_30_length_23132_cov_22.413277_4_plen_321_part_00
MVRDSGGLVSPTDEHDREGSGPRPMLEGREVREGTPEAGLRAAGAAVAPAWRELHKQKWAASRAWEQEQAAVDELLGARMREEECADAAARARERVRQVRGDVEAMVEAARESGCAATQRAMEEASGRLQAVVLRVRRADDDLAIAEAEADDAEDVVDVLGAVAEGVNVRADCAQEMLRAAEQCAAWLRAVVVVARMRRGRGRQEEMECAEMECAVGDGAAGAASDGVAGGVTRAVGGGAASGAEGTVGDGAADSAEGEESGTRSAAMLLVAEEAAAEGAMRQELGRFAAVLGTWLAALARERSRRRAAERRSALCKWSE